MSKDALIGYIAGRLTEVLAETKVSQDTGCSGLSVYVIKLRGTCEALLRLCMSHTDGYNSFVGEHDVDLDKEDNNEHGRSEQQIR